MEKTNSQDPSLGHFGRLPAEVRNTIYEFSFGAAPSITIGVALKSVLDTTAQFVLFKPKDLNPITEEYQKRTDTTAPTFAALSHTNRKVREESRPVFFKEAAFGFHVYEEFNNGTPIRNFQSTLRSIRRLVITNRPPVPLCLLIPKRQDFVPTNTDDLDVALARVTFDLESEMREPRERRVRIDLPVTEIGRYAITGQVKIGETERMNVTFEQSACLEEDVKKVLDEERWRDGLTADVLEKMVRTLETEV